MQPRAAGSRTGRGASSTGQHVVYGRNPVYEALKGRRHVHEVLIAGGRGSRELEQSVVDWCTRMSCAVPRVQRLPDAELTALVGTGDHQGIAAEVDPYPYVELEEILEERDLITALDQIQDPHNLGAIIRTAAATGAGVLIPRHRAAEVTATVVKTSAGATEHTPIARVRNLADALADAKASGFWIFGAEAGEDSLYTLQDYREPTCFVLGSEGRGLGRRVASLCDVMIGIPVEGRVNSLNVSVSAGVLLYEAVRQRSSRATETPRA